MIGELTPAEIEHLLHEHVIGRIGCHTRDRTYVVPITFAYVDGAIVSHTGDGLKVHMMRENPSVCFEVEDLRHLPRWSSVIAWGRYDELHAQAADVAFSQLVARLSASPPGPSDMPWEGAGVFEPISYSKRADVVFRILLEERTGRYDQ
jgi:nitroimidazol reductase NimA-like FMN-containing flavoprotein (pyridoxamine 5'-phosphate oxidase superfamily)